jgi:hypothetical protein
MSELTKALIAFHQQVDKIDKNARGNYGRFADLANVLSTITPALNANGLVITQTFLDDSLVTTLRHVSGESESSTTKLYIADGRNVTQEWGKAVTYQRRYAICSIVGLVADMDTDGEPTPEPEKKPAAKKSVQKKAAPKPEPTPVDIMDSPIPNDARQVVLDLLKQTFAKDADKVKSLTTAFHKAFPDTANLPLSQAFTTERHCAFINDFLAS